MASTALRSDVPNHPPLNARIATAVAVAGRFADEVDTQARFPKEAFDELRSQRLLGLLLPKHLGGEDASLRDVAEICYGLGQACSSTAMIYAMHQANLFCLINHAGESEIFASFLRRIAEAQMLIASSTTEGANGANLRVSEAAIIRDGDKISLNRNASVISYGADADAIVTTARRAPDALPSDQVLALFFKDDYRLARTVPWNVMGMRGTCSEGFTLEATGVAAQVLAEPYAKIHQRSMLPGTHLLWVACWAGVAAGSVTRAQTFVSKISRAAKGVLPPGAPMATQASLSLMTLVNLVDSSLADYERRLETEGGLEGIAFQAGLNLLKVSASELAVTTVMHALSACGISGYRNDSEFSVSRPLRDILSSTVMINNSRILANVGPSCLIGGIPQSIGRG